jgi:pilus assembly protein CpaC
MIAGLLQSQNDQVLQRVPGVGRMPVIGALFSSKAYQRRETDLVIIVTPRLVQPRAPGQKLATPLDSSLPSNEKEFFLRGQQEVKAQPENGFTGHIIDWKDEAPVDSGWKEFSK